MPIERFWRRCKQCSDIIAALSAIPSVIGAILLFTPKISVSPGLNINSAEPYSQLFYIKNEGFVSVSDLTMICAAGDIVGHDIKPNTTIPDYDASYIPLDITLHPGETISRDCSLFGGKKPPTGASLADTFDIAVSYSWPLFRFRHSEIRLQFKLIRTDKGYFLAPDVH